jgi:hypothetical protein
VGEGGLAAFSGPLHRGGQDLGGVLLDNVLLDDPMDRLVDNYASRYSNWLLHR